MMEIITANLVFSKIDFQDDIDYNIYPVSIYECPVCSNKLSFNMQNFKKYSMNTNSSFSLETQMKIKNFIKMQNQKESNSFIDFCCPKCDVKTRIYFTIWCGGRSACGFNLDFIVIV